MGGYGAFFAKQALVGIDGQKLALRQLGTAVALARQRRGADARLKMKMRLSEERLPYERNKREQRNEVHPHAQVAFTATGGSNVLTPHGLRALLKITGESHFCRQDMIQHNIIQGHASLGDVSAM